MKNKKITIIAIVCILIAIAGGVLGYLYGTDTFKSNKDKFFKYIAQNKEISTLLKDDWIEAYTKKQSESPFENNGEITLNATTGETSIDETLKNISVNFDGKTDTKNKKVQQDINVKYLEQSIPVKYVQDGDKFAIKLNGDTSDYLAVENNNLKEFAEKLGVQDSTNIPDKINLDNLKKEFFTDEELKQIYNTYYDILVKEFEDKEFSEVTNNNQKGYKLTITDTKLLSVCTKLLETLKNDNMLLEKIAKYSDKEYTVEELQKQIDETLEDLKSETTQNKEILYISVYKEKGKLVRTEIETANMDDSSIKIVITKTDESAKIEMTVLDDGETVSMNLNIDKVKEKSNLKYNIELNMKAKDNESMKFIIGLEYNNIKELKEVNEKYTIGLNASLNNTDISGNIAIINNNKFVDNVETESLSTVKTLNEYNSEELSDFLSGLVEPLQEILGTSNTLNNTLDDTTTDSLLQDLETDEEDNSSDNIEEEIDDEETDDEV